MDLSLYSFVPKKALVQKKLVSNVGAWMNIFQNISYLFELFKFIIDFFDIDKNCSLGENA